MPKSSLKRFNNLKSKFEKREKNIQDTFWKSNGPVLCWLTEKFPSKQLAAGSLGGLLLLSSPTISSISTANPNTLEQKHPGGVGKGILLREDLAFEVPVSVRPLTGAEEKNISETLSKYYGFKVTPEIDGRRLNRSYGVIGTEQHLYRYPGDELYKHADDAFEWSTFGRYGVAPGLGAWGYFSSSRESFSGKDALREKYYIAVQTFLSPGFVGDVAGFRDFFKFRKVLVVNPINGQAVVTDIGDAGPAPWTGKHLGGSPEVMYYLGLSQGPAKGPVLYFFIDDPQDQIPLGPITP